MATEVEEEVQHDNEEVKSDDSDVDDTQDEATEVTLEDGGIIKKIITKGTGWEKPPVGAECFVHYVGTLEDGTKFDSSRDRDQPFSFKIGQGSVIKGWDKGVATMKKGEKALLICKPEFAYGASGSPPKIPPNATLHFEVELLSFSSLEKVTDDGQVTKKVVEAGDGWKSPKELGKVNAKIIGKLKNETVFYRHEGELDVSDPSLPWGLAEGLLKAKKGQKLFLYVQPEYGYGEAGNKQLGVPPNAELEYDISVVDFTNPKDSWDMSKTEKIDHGVRLKEVGNALFKTSQFKRAKKVYESVSKLYEFDKDLEPDIQAAVDKLKVEASANAAACSYHQKDWADTIEKCNAALKVDQSHTKSLFRRAQAHGQNGDNDVALRDIQHLREIIALKEEKGEPIGVDKAAVDKFAQSIKARIAHAEKKQRKIFGGFFSKLSLVSEDEVKKSQAKSKPMDEDSSDEEPPKAEPSKPEPEPAPADQPAVADVAIEATKEAKEVEQTAAVPQEEEPKEAKTETKGKGKGKKGSEPAKQPSKKETAKAKVPSKKETAKAPAPADPAPEEPKKEEKKPEPKSKGKAEPKKGKAKGAEPKVEEVAPAPAQEPVVEEKAEPAPTEEKSGGAQDTGKPKSKKPAKTPSKETAKPVPEPAATAEPKVEEPKAEPTVEKKAAAPSSEKKAAASSPEKKAPAQSAEKKGAAAGPEKQAAASPEKQAAASPEKAAASKSKTPAKRKQ